MRGIVQLPDYLERLQSGHRDIPIVLLPLLNELRAVARREGPERERAVLAGPVAAVAGIGAGPAGAAATRPSCVAAPRLCADCSRARCCAGSRTTTAPSTIRDLTDVCEQLVPITSAEPARRLFWVAAGTLDALGKNAFADQQSAQAGLGQGRARDQAAGRWRRRGVPQRSADRADPPAALPRRPRGLRRRPHRRDPQGLRPERRRAERSRTRACPRQPQRPQSRAARHRGGRDQGRPAAREGCARPASAHARRIARRSGAAGRCARSRRRHARHARARAFRAASSRTSVARSTT